MLILIVLLVFVLCLALTYMCLHQRRETSKLDDFDGDEQYAAEYSDVKTCKVSDSGYHCSCYDKREFGECCLCGKKLHD